MRSTNRNMHQQVAAAGIRQHAAIRAVCHPAIRTLTLATCCGLESMHRWPMAGRSSLAVRLGNYAVVRVVGCRTWNGCPSCSRASSSTVRHRGRWRYHFTATATARRIRVRKTGCQARHLPKRTTITVHKTSVKQIYPFEITKMRKVHSLTAESITQNCFFTSSNTKKRSSKQLLQQVPTNKLR